MKINVYTNHEYLKNYFYDLSGNINVFFFLSAKRLVEQPVHTTNNIFILDLDFDAEEINIITTARQINRLYPSGQIIFIGNNDSYNSDIYLTKHCYYIKRDEIDYKLSSAVLKAVQILYTQALTIKSKGEYCQIPISSIHHVERDGIERKTYIYLKNNSSYICSLKIEELMEMLPDTLFAICHTSYIVPLEDIRLLCRTKITLSDGATIPVSRSRFNEIKNYVFFAD